MALSKLSSSSFSCDWAYDVFISFRGEDTRTAFTGHLFNALRQRGIRTFFDVEELKRGEEIGSSLVEAIKKSRIAIIVFSQDYASSAFCLNELLVILDHIEEDHRLVWPIFYNVNPSDVRNIRGSFKDSFAKHEESFKDDKEKVLKWKLALQKASNLAGYHFISRYSAANSSGDHFISGPEYEYQFIERIVDAVSIKINQKPLHVADNLVGLEPSIQHVLSHLKLELDDRVNMVGIWGIGGIGKSAIARAVYNRIADQFEGICFLEFVENRALEQMQEELLRKAAGERNIQLTSVYEGIPTIKRRLQNKKILLVLDNVDNLNQLNNIAGGTDWFGKGSRVIITTRNMELLTCHHVKRVYEVEVLNHEKALELFSWNAFKRREVDPNFLDLSNRMVYYAGGLPLALEVIGSHLAGKGIDEWSSTLEKYESISEEKIDVVLKVSYDGLGDDEKKIFLDIACCFEGNSLDSIKEMLAACYSGSVNHSLDALVDKCLLKTNGGLVTMHDLIQRMGKEIVRKESTQYVDKRSRLWNYKDVVHVLKNKRGSNKIEVITMDPPRKRKVHWDGEAFKKMKKLRILVIKNTRFSRRIKYLPQSLKVLVLRKCTSSRSGLLQCDFPEQELVILDLSYTCFRWDKPLLQDFSSLTFMNFIGCDSLQQIADMSGTPNIKELRLDECHNLIEIHKSIGFLKKLEVLSAKKCYKLSIFPRVLKLPSLKDLNLQRCCRLWSFPNILEENENDLDIDLVFSGIEELPPSIVKLKGLRDIKLFGCKSLKRVRASKSARFHFFERSEGLEKAELSPNRSLEDRVVFLSGCDWNDKCLSPTCVFSFYHVTHLDLSYNCFKLLPASFEQCRSLMKLHLNNCLELQEIEGIPPNIFYLSTQGCESLSSRSSSMLARQVMLKTDRLFILPGKDVLNLFDHPCNDVTVTFWFRKKVPMNVITLCFVVKEFSNFQFTARINGSENFDWNPMDCGRFQLDYWVHEDNLIFYNLDLVKLCDKVQLSEPEWNCVEITNYWSGEIGVCINKQETSMDDITLEDPHSFQPHKKQRTLPDMGACETSDAQHYGHCTSPLPKNFWVNKSYMMLSSVCKKEWGVQSAKNDAFRVGSQLSAANGRGRAHIEALVDRTSAS